MPHTDGDYVLLSPTVTIPMGSAFARAVQEHPKGGPALEAAISEAFILGIEGWSFVNEGGPVPVTRESIDEWLPWAKGGADVIERANDLYAEAAYLPLLARMPKSSPPGPTDASTSPSPSSGGRRLKHSKRSSRSDSAGRLFAVPVP